MTTYNTEITFKGMSDDLKKLETMIRKHQLGFVDFGEALTKVSAGETPLYKERGFATFEVYCNVMFEIDRQTAYKAMKAATVFRLLESAGFKGKDLPANEAQCRPLTASELTDSDKVTIWHNVLSSVKSSKGKVSQALVLTHVVQHLKPEETKKPTPEPTPEPTPGEPGASNQMVTPDGAQTGETGQVDENNSNLPFTPDDGELVVLQPGAPETVTGVKGALSGAGEVSELRSRIAILEATNRKLEIELSTAKSALSKPGASKLLKEVIKAGYNVIRNQVSTPEHRAELEMIKASYIDGASGK